MKSLACQRSSCQCQLSYSMPPSFFFKVCLRFVYGHSACMYVHALRMCPVAHGTQKTLIELQMVVSHMWVLGLNSGPLQEQQELLTAEPSLQPPTMISFNGLSRSSLCEALPERDVVVCAGSPLPGLTTSGNSRPVCNFGLSPHMLHQLYFF